MVRAAGRCGSLAGSVNRESIDCCCGGVLTLLRIVLVDVENHESYIDNFVVPRIPPRFGLRQRAVGRLCCKLCGIYCRSCSHIIRRLEVCHHLLDIKNKDSNSTT